MLLVKLGVGESPKVGDISQQTLIRQVSSSRAVNVMRLCWEQEYGIGKTGSAFKVCIVRETLQEAKLD